MVIGALIAIGIALHLVVGIVLLRYAWNDREAELHEETMRLRHRRRVGDEEEQKWA